MAHRVSDRMAGGAHPPKPPGQHDNGMAGSARPPKAQGHPEPEAKDLCPGRSRHIRPVNLLISRGGGL
jgi:hypothetical protein